MEYGLWRTGAKTYKEFCKRVLILVLMEYGLWPTPDLYALCREYVLILVLMEYGLWQMKDLY